MDGATVDAWLYFPGLKVGDKIDIYSSFFKIFSGVDYKSLRRHRVRLFPMS
jgi:hypothetical protein